MACPLCGDQCRCSARPAEASHVSVLIDPEHFEDSEAEFASSLAATVSDADDSVIDGDVHDVFGSGTPIVTPRLENVTTTLIEAATTEPPPQFYRPPEPPVWRDEVTSRVDAYQAKRGRGRRYDPSSSLSLNFDAMPQAETPAPARYASVRLDMVDRPEGAASEGKLIEFPKPMPVASVTELPPLPHVEELAEPVVETPRILDVPEGAHPLTEQPLAHIQFEQEDSDPALDYIAQSIDLPLPIAPMGPRVGAGMVDLLIVLTATAIFGMIFMMIAKELPQGRDLAACALALPSLLWAAYHYAFLVRCGTTPGMQMAQLGLSPFKTEDPITLNHRRARALAMSVSAMSLGLGFLWAMLDEDRLTWHDRISHTFLVNH